MASAGIRERVKEFAARVERMHGHCCGDVINLYAEDLENAIMDFLIEEASDAE